MDGGAGMRWPLKSLVLIEGAIIVGVCRYSSKVIIQDDGTTLSLTEDWLSAITRTRQFIYESLAPTPTPAKRTQNYGAVEASAARAARFGPRADRQKFA